MAPRRRDTPWLSSVEVTGLLKVDGRTVSRWARTGRLPSVRLRSGTRRFPVDGVLRLLDRPEPCTGEDHPTLTGPRQELDGAPRELRRLAAAPGPPALRLVVGGIPSSTPTDRLTGTAEAHPVPVPGQAAPLLLPALGAAALLISTRTVMAALVQLVHNARVAQDLLGASVRQDALSLLPRAALSAPPPADTGPAWPPDAA